MSTREPVFGDLLPVLPEGRRAPVRRCRQCERYCRWQRAWVVYQRGWTPCPACRGRGWVSDYDEEGAGRVR